MVKLLLVADQLDLVPNYGVSPLSYKLLCSTTVNNKRSTGTHYLRPKIPQLFDPHFWGASIEKIFFQEC